MNRLTRFVSLWRGVFSLLKASAPILSVAVGVLTLLEAAASIGVLYVIKILVDTISSELGTTSNDGFGAVIQALLLTGGAVLFAALLQRVNSVLKMRQGLLVSDHVDKQIHDRAISVDLRFYESPNYYDSLERARHGGNMRPARAVSNVISMISTAITLIGIFVLLATIEWRLIPILVIPIILALFVRLYYTRRLFNWRMSKAQRERRALYLDTLMTHVQHAKELRLNRIGEFLRDQYRAIRVEVRNGEISIEQGRHISEFLFAVIGTIVFIGTSSWLLFQSLEQSRPLGDVVLFVLLLRRAESSGSTFVGNMSSIVDDHLYLQRLFSFLSVEPGITRPKTPVALPSPMSDGLKISNVSFRYDGTDKTVLRNVSMELRPKQIVALVGENGSGKTTLIKLLTRLYDPTDGSVTLDGTDIRRFDPVEFRRLFSVILQDYTCYAATVDENIKFGDISLNDAELRIADAAEKAGATSFIEQLHSGYQTPLTRLFDNGHDLSIGQWQRLALARAFYPESEFVILDEPTSAVDPKAEFELFENFRARLGDRGALIISHRLSTIRQADYTYVLEAGEIVEHGTHDALVKNGGKYADLFEKQARHYR